VENSTGAQRKEVIRTVDSRGACRRHLPEWCENLAGMIGFRHLDPIFPAIDPSWDRGWGRFWRLKSTAMLVVLDGAMQCVSITWMYFKEPITLREPPLIKNSVLFPFAPFFMFDKWRKRSCHYASHTVDVSSCYFKVRKRHVGENGASHKSRRGDGSTELPHQCEVVLDLPLDQRSNIRNVAFIL
jgi:hypothetical protein